LARSDERIDEVRAQARVESEIERVFTQALGARNAATSNAKTFQNRSIE